MENKELQNQILQEVKDGNYKRFKILLSSFDKALNVNASRFAIGWQRLDYIGSFPLNLYLWAQDWNPAKSDASTYIGSRLRYEYLHCMQAIYRKKLNNNVPIENNLMQFPQRLSRMERIEDLLAEKLHDITDSFRAQLIREYVINDMTTKEIEIKYKKCKKTIMEIITGGIDMAVRYSYEGGSYTAKELSKHPDCKVKYDTLLRRLNKNMPIEEAMIAVKIKDEKFSYNGETKSILNWSRDERCQVTYMTLYYRIRTADWPFAKAFETPPDERRQNKKL